MATYSGNILIYSIHRTEKWWRAVGNSLGYEQCHIVSDLRGDGDHCVVDDFYAFHKKFMESGATSSSLLSADAVEDVIARCRVLRWLDCRVATAMALAMAEAFSLVLNRVNPVAIVSFPIDRYVSDVLERIARARGIPYFELTPGVVPETSMLLYRGKLIERLQAPAQALVQKALDVIANPSYLPTYLPSNSRFTPFNFLKTFGYFRLRGWAFKAISIAKADPLNLHYLDSQAFLGHKPRLKDIMVTRMFDSNWHDVLQRTDKQRVLFIGLPLFPEASIDYWIDDLQLIAYEALVVEVAKAFAEYGFAVMVKDHPLQFGFRQTELLKQLKAIPGVYLVPYDVTGSYMMTRSGVHFTTTGTLGLQSALAGLQSIVTPSYYANDVDFHLLRSRQDVSKLPKTVAESAVPTPSELQERKYRIMERVVRGTIYEDLYSRNGFDGSNISPAIAAMGKILGESIHHFGRSGENWHSLATRNPYLSDVS